MIEFEYLKALPSAVELFKSLNKKETKAKLEMRTKRMLNFLATGETKVGIFGAGGTGKSTFGKLLITCLLYTSPSPRDRG